MSWQGNQGGFMRGNEGEVKGDKPAGTTNACPPVMVKQILAAHHDEAEETFTLDGCSPSLVTVVGKILKVQPQSSNIVYEIEDGTGVLEARLWLQGDDKDEDAQRRAQWREGVYVRVVGSLRYFKGARSLVAQHMQLVTDHNEITYHILQSLLTHLKGTQPTSSAITATPSHSVIGGSGIYSQPSAVNTASATSGNSTFEKPIYGDVLLAFKAGHNPTGLPVTEVCAALSKMYTESDIRLAVEWLSAEGHIYSTITDEHFKATDEDD